MRDRHDGTGEIMKKTLQPGHGFGIKMVGRLVEQQHIGGAQKQLAQRDPALLAARQPGHVGLARRHTKRVHGDLGLAFEIPTIDGIDLLLQIGLFGDHRVHLVIGQFLGEAGADLVEAVHQLLGLAHAGKHIAGHIHALVKLGLLRQITDLDSVGGPGLAIELGVQPGHDPQQCGLTGTIQAENANLGTRKEGQADILQHFLAAGPALGQAMHDINILMAGHDVSPGSTGGRRQHLSRHLDGRSPASF